MLIYSFIIIFFKEMGSLWKDGLVVDNVALDSSYRIFSF